MGGRGETGKANTVALGLGAGNWEGPASSPGHQAGGLAGLVDGRHQRASFIASTPQLGPQRQRGAQRFSAWRSSLPSGPRAKRWH